jgi:hypothetical protein
VIEEHLPEEGGPSSGNRDEPTRGDAAHDPVPDGIPGLRVRRVREVEEGLEDLGNGRRHVPVL